MPAQVLVVALLDAKVAETRLPIYNLTPWKRAAAVAKEADDKEHGGTVWMYGTLAPRGRAVSAGGCATGQNAGTIRTPLREPPWQCVVPASHRKRWQ